MAVQYERGKRAYVAKAAGKLYRGGQAGEESGSSVIAVGYCVGIFAFIGSMGTLNWQSAGYLDFDASWLALCCCVDGVRQRLSSHPPCSSLFIKWSVTSQTVYVYLCRSSSAKRGLKNRGRNEAM